MGLRELKKTRTRQAIRRAAMRLFGDQGYEATTVEQIAADAEISTATFYRYYCDKADVVVNPGTSHLIHTALPIQSFHTSRYRAPSGAGRKRPRGYPRAAAPDFRRARSAGPPLGQPAC